MPRYLAFLVFAAIPCVLASGGSIAQDREVFQVTFGSRTYLGDRGPVTDGGLFLTEVENGDIVVAGHGASTFTDVGRRIKPMLALISPAGHVVWKHIYTDLIDHAVEGLLTREGRQYVLLNEDLGDRRQRVSLREVRADGSLSPELSGIDDIYVAEVIPYQDGASAGFLITARPTDTGENRGLFQRDLSLFHMAVTSSNQRLPFPEGIKEAQQLQREKDGGLVFLRAAAFGSLPTEVVRVSPEGELTVLFELENEVYARFLIATSSRVYIVENVNWRNPVAPVTAFTRDGRKIWQTGLHDLTDIRSTIQLGNDLLLAGTYEDNPVIVRLDEDGNPEWTRRFRSARRDAFVASMAVLDDGWLALTGSTSPGSGGTSSMDNDGFLAVTDPNGEGLGRFDACLADMAEIEALRSQLFNRAGLEVKREILITGHRPPPVEELPPLDLPLQPPLECDAVSELDLVRFLKAAVAEAKRLNLSKPSGRVKAHVLLRPPGAIPAPGYREWRRLDGGARPSIEVNVDNAIAAIRHIATAILPYTERMLTVTDELRARTGMWVGASRDYGIGSGLPPFRENTEVAERFLALFLALSPEDQSAVQTRIGNHPVVVSADPDVLHLWGDRWIMVGRNRIDEVFDFLLTDLPEIQRQIAEAGKRVRDEIGVAVTKNDPNIPHAEFLNVMRRIHAALDDLSAADKAIIHAVRPVVTVRLNMASDIFMPGYRQQIIIAPVAADELLEYILENADEIRAQPYERPQ